MAFKYLLTLKAEVPIFLNTVNFLFKDNQSFKYFSKKREDVVN